jgi:hypothetical protein
MQRNFRSRLLVAVYLFGFSLPPACAMEQVASPAISYSGTVTLAANTSTALIAANVIMSPNSGPLPAPGTFGRLVIIPPANCAVTVNWFGGTAGTGTGESIGSGTNVGTDAVNLLGLPNAPTLFSAAGCPVYFRN